MAFRLSKLMQSLINGNCHSDIIVFCVGADSLQGYIECRGILGAIVPDIVFFLYSNVQLNTIVILDVCWQEIGAKQSSSGV
jgi:hypothetical protein